MSYELNAHRTLMQRSVNQAQVCTDKMAQIFYASLRDMFGATELPHINLDGTPGKPTMPPEGSLSVEGFSVLRGFLGTLLPSRFYADMIIGLILVGVTILLAISIFTSCRRLGCAFITLGFQCFCLLMIVFWLYTVWQLSNQEYHESYIEKVEWLLMAWKNAAPRSK